MDVLLSHFNLLLKLRGLRERTFTSSTVRNLRA